MITESKLSISFGFLTDSGKSFTVSMNNVDPELKNDEALETKIATAQAAIIALQPFAVTLESAHGWALTTTEKLGPE